MGKQTLRAASSTGVLQVFSLQRSARSGLAAGRCLITFLTCCFASLAVAQSTHWVVSWGASPSPSPNAAQAAKDGLEFTNQTLREVVHLSIGGSAVRVRISNLFGKQGLEIGTAHLALRSSDSGIHPSSDRVLTFGGAPRVTIPPNAVVLSDPVNLSVPAESDVAISIFVPHAATAAGIHYFAFQTSYVGAGDQTASPVIANPRAISSWIFLAGVDVSAPPSAAAIAAFGDSRIDGDGSTPNTNRRWPNLLAHRLAQKGLPLGVLNAGIVGNRILHDAPQDAIELGVSGLSRFDRDALDQPGIKYVIVLEGIVDIGLPGTSVSPDSEAVSVDDLVMSMKQFAQRANERGMKIFVTTQTAFSGGTVVPGIFSPEKEVKRKVLNQWIRSSREFDGIIDFDKVVLDPTSPEKLRPEFDSGDHIHPNDAGYQAMSDAIDLALFQ
ncbi:MAG TPA: SGNH/GDSL hydrolase family protein [Terriglobales bacterium]|nr:SGNH/GDSL hydrolase family protein [Terriglobales bacterium]